MTMLRSEPVVRFTLIRLAIYLLGLIGLEVTEGDISEAVAQLGLLIPAAVALIEVVTAILTRRQVTPVRPF